MNEIYVFYDNTSYTLIWLRALVWAREEFYEEGFLIRFNLTDAYIPKMNGLFSLPNCKEFYLKLFSKREYDIVFLAYHHSNNGLCKLSPDDRADVLSYLRTRCNMIVWLDTADGTGTCIFDVLPYVDIYLKKQVLVDKKRYFKPIWSNRVFGEYYHNLFGIDESGQKEKMYYPVLDEKYIDRIGVSWNVGLGDLFIRGIYDRLVYRRKKKIN